MNEKEMAIYLFGMHYQIIMEIGEDLSQECIVSLLAIKHAIKSIEVLMTHYPTSILNHMETKRISTYWFNVIKELEKL